MVLGAARGGDEIYTWMSGCDASLYPCHSRQGLVNRVMRKGAVSRHRCGGDTIYASLSGCERFVIHAAVARGSVNRVSL
jgi:hypothetical protein